MSNIGGITKTTCLYLGGSLAIVLILFLIVQSYRIDKKLIKDINKRYNIIVKTPKGLVSTDNYALADELEHVKKMIINNQAGANGHCIDLTPKINAAMKNLARFIQDNPADNSEALCNLELKAEIINQYLTESVTPEMDDWGTNYKSLLEWENYERELPANPIEKLEFLIKNLDITVKLLRFNICNNGHIDLEQLYKILLDLNKQICKVGSMHTPTGQQIEFGYDPYTRYNKPPPLPLFLLSQSSIEPFENRPNDPRSLPPKGSFGKLNIDKERIRPEMMLTHSELLSDDQLMPNEDFSGVLEERDFADLSIEGSVERDILGYKPPGHIISQLYDPEEHYTVNVNSCGGKTVSDAELVSQCVSQDMKLLDAVNGNPNKMLDCIGDCNKEPNYFRWYHKLNNAVADMEFILGTENDP